MSTDEELQRDITRLALRALHGTPFALAGSGAIREHGIIDRPTQDIDLFTSDLDAGRFDTAVSSVVNGIRDAGHAVDELRRVEQFARLHITTDEGRFVEMDLGVDYREGEPVTLSVGPVLSLDDAVANKVSALYSRAEARDYLDVDAIRTSGKFTDTELIAAARERDLGFEVPMFAAQLEAVQRLRPDQTIVYNVDAAELDALKTRLTSWAAELRAPERRPGGASLDPELQRLAALRRLSFPTAPGAQRTAGPTPPTATPDGRSPEQNRDHGRAR